MSKLDDAIHVNYNNKDYSVVSFKFKNVKYPLIFDTRIYKIIKKLDRKWYVNDKRYIYTHKNGSDVEIYIHEVIKKILVQLKEDTKNTKAIVHLDKITFDNRTVNLQWDINDKDVGKNLMKKSRTAELPDECDIDMDDLPTFLWYIKSTEKTSDRFYLNIGNVKWKSTSSSKLSTRYKLEESKKHMRYLKKNSPELFSSRSMNSDFNKYGQKLLDEYVEIANKAGFDKLNKVNLTKKTDKILCEDVYGLTNLEKYLLDTYDPKDNVNINTRIKSYQKKYHKLTIRLPKYCKYNKGKMGNGDGYYVIKDHPNCKQWEGTNSKLITTENKYKELKDKLHSLSIKK